MGKNMKHAFEFATKYPGWHYFARDRATINAIHSLYRRGLVQIKQHCFRVK
jgi:hypothetical protein